MHYTFESMPFCNLPLELVTEVLKKANLNTRQYMSLISQNHTNYVVSKVVLAGMAHIWHVRLHAISFFRHVIGSYLYPSSFSPSDVARLLPLPLCKTATSLSVLKDGMGKLIWHSSLVRFFLVLMWPWQDVPSSHPLSLPPSLPLHLVGCGLASKLGTGGHGGGVWRCLASPVARKRSWGRRWWHVKKGKEDRDHLTCGSHCHICKTTLE